MHEIVKQHLRPVNIVGVIMIVAIGAASVGLGVIPSIRRGRASIEEAGRIQKQLDDFNDLTTQISNVEKDLDETTKRLEDAERRLPSSNAMGDFTRQLTAVARQAGLQIESFTPAKELKDSGGYKALPVEITGTGDWETCYRFLTGLRSMDRLTRLDAISLDLVRDTKGTFPDRPICHMTVSISTFIAR